jgi:hypothetical protein
LERHCKALFVAPCITCRRHVQLSYPRQNSACIATL